MTEHDEIAELLGAYALDAVEPDEAALVEDHLRECPRCAAEVAEHREVAAMLAHSGAPAPEGIWERIVEGLEEPPPEINLPVGAPPPPGVIDLGARRRSRVPARWVPAAAAAAGTQRVATRLRRRAPRSITPALGEAPTGSVISGG